MANNKYGYERTRVGKHGLGEQFEARFNPRDYEKSGRPGMPGTGDVDSGARAADMARAAVSGEWQNPNAYFGTDWLAKRNAERRNKQIAKEKKKGEYEYKDNAKGALEKLYDAGITNDNVTSYGTMAGIKVVNSLSDADAIIKEMYRSSGDYTDKKFKQSKKDKPKNDKPKEEAPIRLSEELKGAQDRVRHHDEGIRSGQSSEDLYDFSYKPTENAKAFAGKYARDVGKAGGFKADNDNFKRALEAVRQ